MSQKLFPVNIPEMEWIEFVAEGFSEPVCGVIHRASGPITNGMPLGGIDTGCLDLETNGTFGYCSIFNSHVPRRGPLNLPFLGLAIGSETWVLSSQKFKGYSFDLNKVRALQWAQGVKEIHYWGHYPAADLEYEIDSPVHVGLRAWSPFIPGDIAISNTPGAVFEVHLRNTTDLPQKGTVVFSFPGPSLEESDGISHYSRSHIDGKFSGIVVTNAKNVEYALGVLGKEEIRTGGDLGLDGGAWSRFARDLPDWGRDRMGRGLPVESDQAGSSLAVDFELKAKEERVIRFVLAWYSPDWKSGGNTVAKGNTYTHMYASRYKNALDVAQLLSDEHQSILERILAWQQVIYTEKKLPVWLRETLVNILHLITEDSFWAQAKPPISDWCRKEDGLFGMNECPRACPQIECIGCSMYGNIPLVYFFPELALSTLRAYRAYQFPEGTMPFVFGGCTVGSPPCEMAMPARGYEKKPQTTLDGASYTDMVERLWLRTGNFEILREFYPSVKKNTVFTMNLRPEDGPRGVISMPSGNNGQDWFEDCELCGMVSHVGGLHMAQLKMAERMAEKVGDKEFSKQCSEWFKQGSLAMEEHLWTGKYYLLYNELETGKKSDVIMGYQLDGEWMAKFHGLHALPPERVKTTLSTLKQTVVTQRGAVVFKSAKEKEFKPGYWRDTGMHVAGSLMLAMTYMYHGERDFGLELARRVMHTVIIELGRSWDSPIVILTDTGEIIYGNDYYQNMMLWSMPAALESDELAGPCKPGGLVERIIQAGKKIKI